MSKVTFSVNYGALPVREFVKQIHTDPLQAIRSELANHQPTFILPNGTVHENMVPRLVTNALDGVEQLVVRVAELVENEKVEVRRATDTFFRFLVDLYYLTRSLRRTLKYNTQPYHDLYRCGLRYLRRLDMEVLTLNAITPDEEFIYNLKNFPVLQGSKEPLELELYAMVMTFTVCDLKHSSLHQFIMQTVNLNPDLGVVDGHLAFYQNLFPIAFSYPDRALNIQKFAVNPTFVLTPSTPEASTDAAIEESSNGQ